MICAPSKDSDHPGHLPSLTRVFAVHMKEAWVLSYPLIAQWGLWSDWEMPRLNWVFVRRTVISLVLSCTGLYKVYNVWWLCLFAVMSEGIYMSRDMTKPAKWVCSQRTRSAQSDQSLLCAQWVAKDPTFLHADSKDSDQTGWMPSLIRVFAGRTATLFVLSCCGSHGLQQE